MMRENIYLPKEDQYPCRVRFHQTCSPLLFITLQKHRECLFNKLIRKFFCIISLDFFCQKYPFSTLIVGIKSKSLVVVLLHLHISGVYCHQRGSTFSFKVCLHLFGTRFSERRYSMYVSGNNLLCYKNLNRILARLSFEAMVLTNQK